MADDEPSLFPATPVAPRSHATNPAGSGGTRRQPGSARPGGTPPAGNGPPVAPQPFGVAGAWVGAIDEPVVVRTEHRRFRGFQALLVAGALATAVFVVRAVLSGAAELTSALVGPLIVLLGLLLVYRLILGPVLGRLVRWALRILVSVTAATTRTASRAAVYAGSRAVTAARARNGSGFGQAEHPLTVRRFRARSTAGETRAFTMYGDMHGGELKRGDIVRIRGGRRRDGRVHVRSVDVLATPGGPILRTVTARPSVGYLAMQWGSRLGFVLAAVFLAWTVFVNRHGW